MVMERARRVPKGGEAKKKARRPKWNPYLTDASHYRLSAEEAGRRQREGERCRQGIKPPKPDEDASRLILEEPAAAPTVRVALKPSKKSLAARVWRLEEELEEARADKAELARRLDELAEVVGVLRARVETSDDLRAVLGDERPPPIDVPVYPSRSAATSDVAAKHVEWLGPKHPPVDNDTTTSDTPLTTRLW